MTSKPAGGAFLGSLESLRGVAALLVAFFHVAFSNPVSGWNVVRNGYLLVDLFFVLSGFVMAHAYGARLQTRADAREYLWLRLGRIYPLHLVMTGVFLLLETARWVAQARGAALATPAFSTNSPWALLVNVLLLNAHGLTNELTFNGPSWSIGAEFWAYLAFAGVSLAGLRGRARAVVALVASASLYGTLYVLHPQSLDVHFHGGVLRCLAGFSLGLVVFELAAVVRRAGRLAAELLSLLGLLGVAAVLGFSRSGALDYALPAASALIITGIAAAPDTTLGRALSARPLLWLGKISFSLYMVHVALLRVLTPVLQRLAHGRVDEAGVLVVPEAWGAAWLVVYLAALLPLSAASYRFIEDPARRWFRTRSPRQPSPTGSQPRDAARSSSSP